ncbi:MAG: LysR family transcriptional regulator [Pseudomonadales bacterium]|nr:LysR family transcriptional regulator [Pseudomonadales bacterium]
MNWNELKAFIEVAETGSFSRAAEILHLTQPAVSKRIATLELDLGLPLFDRIGRHVFMTEAGTVLFPRAQSMLQAKKDTRKLLENLNTRIDGRLRMATSHHIGLHRLAPVLKDFSSSFPQVQMDIRFVDSEAAQKLVLDGTTELAVVTFDPLKQTHLTYHAIWSDPLSFVCSPEMDIANKQELKLEELLKVPCILPDLDTFTGQIVAQLFEQANLKLHPTMRTNYLETIAMLISIGQGWSVLPSSMLNEEIQAFDVNCNALFRILGGITHPDRTLSNAGTAFLAILEQHADRPEKHTRF